MAIRGRRQPFAPIIKRLGAPSPIARLVMPTGRLAAQAATNYFHRPPVHAIINRLGAPAPVASRKIVRGAFASQASAAFAHRPLFQAIIKSYQHYATPAPTNPVSQPFKVRGAFASQQAALFAHRPLFPAIINVFVPRRLSGHLKKPMLARVPDTRDRDRMARHTEVLSAAFNSLARQGYLRQTGPMTYRIVGGGVSEARAPGAVDDAEAGFNPGASWVDTTTQKVWFCVDNTIGAAVWRTPF